MSITPAQLEALRTRVVAAATDPSFVHHEWYVTFHLEIFAKIAAELCERYPNADRSIVEALVWLHDFGKMLDVEKQYELSISEGTKLLQEIGVDESFIIKVMEYLVLFEKKMEIDLRAAPIEVQIASSSDAAPDSLRAGDKVSVAVGRRFVYVRTGAVGRRVLLGLWNRRC